MSHVLEPCFQFIKITKNIKIVDAALDQKYKGTCDAVIFSTLLIKKLIKNGIAISTYIFAIIVRLSKVSESEN